MDLTEAHPGHQAEGPRGFDCNSGILARAFFSNENLELIQKKLVIEVYRRLDIKIPYQQPEHVLIAMRHVYTIYAKELPCHYKEQIRELDEKVIKWVLPDVISNAEQHLSYLQLLEGDRPLLDPPIHVGHRGRQFEESKKDIPADRQLTDYMRCCPYDSNPDYPERRPATTG